MRCPTGQILSPTGYLGLAAKSGDWLTVYSQLALLISILLFPEIVQAHKPSDSYLQVEVRQSTLELQWDIALRDLDFAIGLDENGDGNITWGELKSQRQKIVNYVLPRLHINGQPGDGVLSLNRFLVDHHSDGAYLVLGLSLNRGISGQSCEIGYDLFFDFDAQHRGILKFADGAHSRVHIFTPDSRSFTLDSHDSGAAEQFFHLAKEGVWHIWIGFDHILFLVALLFPAVLKFENGKWQVAKTFPPVLAQVAKVVTAFTVAHSITLALSTLGIVHLPSRLVESAIAGTVIVAALNNIYPMFHKKSWLVAFIFGLVHGFGFANVFADLGLRAANLVLPLLSFNFGVEIGQLTIVLIFLPIAFAMRSSRIYESCVLRFGSLGITVVASAWMLERIFNFKVLPF